MSLGKPLSLRLHKGWHTRGYLPHFDEQGAVQSITFRPADSLPRTLCERLAALADGVERRRRVEAAMDEGRGACLLRELENAAIVQAALQHFDGERYRLLAWVIMPNHVHVLMEQIERHRLGDVLHSWKSFTAKEINKRRRGTGTVWAADYFDRFIRDEEHFAAMVRYIEGNPVKAGLVATAAEWRFSSAAR